MTGLKDVEQLPNCQHFESVDTEKNRQQFTVPETRQSLIRKKVNLCHVYKTE